MISLNNVSSTLWNKKVLKNITWSPEFGQSWAIIGPNGAGKSILMKIIRGQLPYCGNIKRHKKISSLDRIANVSFDQQALISFKEGKKAHYENFSGKEEKFLTGRKFIDPDNFNFKELQKIAKQLNISSILENPIFKFSNGELRKTFIAKSLLAKPELLILDEPFDGLDFFSVKWLKKTISDLINSGLPIWLVSHRFDEIVPEISHILCLRSGKVFAQGPRSEILNSKTIKKLFKKDNLKIVNNTNTIAKKEKFNKFFQSYPIKESQKIIKNYSTIKMVNVNISYGNKIVLKDFNWTVKKGENWKIFGGNGAGKSTLLNLIYGDNLQVYSNEIYIFGKRRGTGESIWDIKKRIGIVSPEFHVLYHESISSIKVVLSGFFDSIGYYKTSSKKQITEALKWLDLLGISNLAEQNFTRLSFGQQRLILIARAMIKSPSLLILDEPCQGLDLINKNHILEVVDKVAQISKTQILYTTHIPTENLKCLDHELHFEFISEGKFKITFI